MRQRVVENSAELVSLMNSFVTEEDVVSTCVPHGDLSSEALPYTLEVKVLCPPGGHRPFPDLDMLENILFWETFKDDDGGLASVADTAGDDSNVASPSAKLPTTPSGTPSIPSPPSSPSGDKDKDPPDNVLAFFGHPLTRATNAINGDEQDPEAQAEALLHEYLHLPALDREGSKIGDRLASLIENMRSSDKKEDLQDGQNNVNDYINILLQNDNIDEYFNIQTNTTGNSSNDSGVASAAAAQQDDGMVVSPSIEKDKVEEAKGTQEREKLQKDQARRGAVHRRQSHNLLSPPPCFNSSTTLLPPPSSPSVLRRSESEPGVTLTERLSQQLQGTFQAHQFDVNGDVATLAATTEVKEEDGDDDVTDPEAEVLAAAEAAAAAVAISTDHSVGISTNPAVVVPFNPSSAIATHHSGTDASLTVTASVVTAPTSGVSPRGHCILSSSSPPTSRITPTPGAASRASGTRSKGSRARGGQSRAKKEEPDQRAIHQGPRTNNNNRNNVKRKAKGSGTTVTSSAAGTTINQGLPSAIDTTTVILSKSPLPSSAGSILAVPPTPSPPSDAVPSSVVPPDVAANIHQLPQSETRLVVNPSQGVLSSAVTSPSLPPSAPSSSSATGTVVLLPLPHSTVQDQGILSSTVVVAGECGAEVTVPVSLQTAPPPPAPLGAGGGDAVFSEPVRQTTKDKLKLRIAGSTMTQPLEHGDSTQQSLNTHHQQKIKQGAAQQQQQQQQQQQAVYHQQQQYQLQQQQIHQQQLQVQHQQQESPSPQEALAAAAYLSEDNLAAMNGGGKFAQALPTIKREDQFLDYDHSFPPPYNTPGAMQVLYNSVPMAADGGMTPGGHNGMVAMTTINGDSQALSEADQLISQMSSEPVFVQSQFLHLLQPLDMGQQQQQQQQMANGYYNTNDSLYVYTNNNNNNNNKVDGGLLDMDADKETLMRYAQQQPSMHDPYVYGSTYQQYMSTGTGVDTSPDSGISNDPGLSPKSLGLKEGSLNAGDATATKDGKSLKRRKSSQNPQYNRQYSSGSDKLSTRLPSIQKLEVNTTGYQYFLESPISTTQRLEEDRVTYLNKSQYYPLTLENITPDRVPKGVTCKSVIMLVFRDEKSKEEEAKAWQFWHSRQHSYKQRILDIGSPFLHQHCCCSENSGSADEDRVILSNTKNSQGVGPNSITELAFNAVSVRWNPREGPVRVNIAVHCLSTDFSNQKGVKGIPLHVQIDTYELLDSKKELMPVHRGYCQIKVFCDKGAERKTRDEERRRTAKATKPEASFSPGRKRSEEVYHSPCERSEFYSMADLSTAPVYFNPSYPAGEFQQNGSPSAQDGENSSQLSPSQASDTADDATSAKVARLTSCASCNKHLTPLLYVKESNDKAYHAIHLDVPTVEELLKALSHKFNKQLSNVKNFYKRSKKGILVRMDDNIVRHYSHETAFLLEINSAGAEEDLEVILVETCQ